MNLAWGPTIARCRNSQFLPLKHGIDFDCRCLTDIFRLSWQAFRETTLSTGS